MSHSQVYSWVKKYDAGGENTLFDKRGHHKTDDEVDELEQLRRENIRLKRQLEEKDMLAELLKKVKEFERMCTIVKQVDTNSANLLSSRSRRYLAVIGSLSFIGRQVA